MGATVSEKGFVVATKARFSNATLFARDFQGRVFTPNPAKAMLFTAQDAESISALRPGRKVFEIRRALAASERIVRWSRLTGATVPKFQVTKKACVRSTGAHFDGMVGRIERMDRSPLNGNPRYWLRFAGFSQLVPFDQHLLVKPQST